MPSKYGLYAFKVGQYELIPAIFGDHLPKNVYLKILFLAKILWQNTHYFIYILLLLGPALLVFNWKLWLFHKFWSILRPLFSIKYKFWPKKNIWTNVLAVQVSSSVIKLLNIALQLYEIKHPASTPQNKHFSSIIKQEFFQVFLLRDF